LVLSFGILSINDLHKLGGADGWSHKDGIVAGTPAGLLDTQLADDLDIHDAAQIQRFSPPQV
jgi:hypothetical protein